MSRFLAVESGIHNNHFLQILPLVLSILSLAIATPALAQVQTAGTPVRTLTVTGRGDENIATTISQVQLGVEVQGKTANEVQQEAARRSSAVVEFLKSRNVDKLQTTGISLNPTYNYDNGKQTLTGYIATNTVSFRVDNAQAGTIIDEAVKVGATQINGISFIAPDSAIAAAQKQALREAVEDANQQADAVLASLNLSRQEIIGIQIDGANAPMPPVLPYATVAREQADKAASTPIIGAEQRVEASVTLQIRY
jgi:uncharacterized protein YggE